MDEATGVSQPNGFGREWERPTAQQPVSQPVSRVGWTNVKKNTAGNFCKRKRMDGGGSKGQN
jgi:hypothetical protein